MLGTFCKVRNVCAAAAEAMKSDKGGDATGVDDAANAEMQLRFFAEGERGAA